MRCPKCNDRQYPERIDTDQGTLTLWKCTGCGNSTDPLILKNRQGRKKGLNGPRHLGPRFADGGKRASNA